MIDIHGDYVRVTGLRLRGQSRTTDDVVEGSQAIQVDFPPASGGLNPSMTQYIAMIDHNDISDWESATVNVQGPYTFIPDTHSYTFTVNGQKYTQPTACSFVDRSTGANVLFADDPATLDNVRIERNFLHHNERWSGGYGSLMSAGGRAAISGNTFLMNRHAISGDGEGHEDYRAWYNLALSNVPVYSLSQGRAQQIFDMHGTGPGGYGYIGGYRVDIAGNTFLGNMHNNWSFELRGHPCSTDYFRDNVAQREQDANGGGVINFHHIGDPGVPLLLQGPDVAYTPVTVAPDLRMSEVLDYNNQFGNSSPPYTDPTVRLGPGSLGVGDFDGDSDDDLFLATGTAWYYSPGGAREWRFLSAKADTIEHLLFGDFDGDGRTDVVALRGGQFMVSWGGVSDWEVLNRAPTGGNLLLLPTAITAMAVGDFDGDGRADIFWADGRTWRVSYGGNNPFVEVQTSSHRVKDIRFGDFDGNGTTDVFSVVSDGVSLRWMVSYSPKSAHGALFSSWTYLPVSLTNTVDGLLVADFNGDGVADVATNSADGWQISYRGAHGWTNVRQPLGLVSLSLAGIGHFKGQRGSDVLLWNGLSLGVISLAKCDSNANVNTQLCISVGGTSPATRYSTQDMR
jgi:VCBS repeat protein